jgi:hypothetical protein
LGCQDGHANPDRAGDETVTVRLHERTRTTAAWLLFLATFGCCAAGLAVTLAVTRPLTAGVLVQGAVEALAFRLGFATVGLVLTLRRPANPIGWLYAAAGLVWSLDVPGTPWLAELARAHRALPLAAKLTALAGETNWAPAVALGVTLPLLLLPDGRLRSRRWRPVVVASLSGAVLVVVGGLTPGPLTSLPIANPLALTGWAATAATAADIAGGVLNVGSLVAALVCVVLRFRFSRGVERQQLRWVAAGGAAGVLGLLAVTALLVGGALFGFSSGAWEAVIVLTLPCLPGGIAVAVLRYRLWDLDRLVSRTVTYTLVTALLVVPYLLILPIVTRLAHGAGSLAVAAATLAAAAGFQPLRRRVQDLVDRRFNRRRYDAARTVEQFAARLREQVDLDALSAELLAVVDQTMQPTLASLWLRPPAVPRPR